MRIPALARQETLAGDAPKFLPVCGLFIAVFHVVTRLSGFPDHYFRNPFAIRLVI
jgi:hypothetical protein